MHDANGNELKVGDLVTIHGRITNLSPTTDYCNVTVESLIPRRPDRLKDTMCINTGVTLRANEGDDVKSAATLVADGAVLA